MEQLKKEVSTYCRLHGFTLKVAYEERTSPTFSEACRYACEILEPFEDDERTSWVAKIVQALQRLPLSSPVIDRTTLEAAVSECSKATNTDSDELFEVIDLFGAPKLDYNWDRRKFQECKEPLSLNAPMEAKGQLLRDRIALVLQRTLRHELFSNTDSKYRLKTVEALLGCHTKQENVLVLGLLSQMKAGKFFLEDLSGNVEIDISNAVFHNGLFTEGSIVLVEGSYKSNLITAQEVGMPPVETSEDSRKHFGELNFFGGTSRICFKANKKLRKLGNDNQDATVVFISDVWLDDENVLKGLYHLFSGFSSSPPVAFVFAGNFCSRPHGPQHYQLLKTGFKRLADVMKDFPDLVNNSKFVFLPGMQDPALTDIMPRMPLPNVLISPLTEKIPNCIFTTNPCRLRFGAQEIVVFRDDIVEKMARNCVSMPSAHSEIPEHVAKSLHCQGHLTPLPLHVCPVYWQYDYCMRLYPVPDLLVVCDKHQPFTVPHAGAKVANPGSFARNNLSFQVYIPATGEVEDSAIDFE